MFDNNKTRHTTLIHIELQREFFKIHNFILIFCRFCFVELSSSFIHFHNLQWPWLRYYFFFIKKMNIIYDEYEETKEDL